MKTIKFSCFFVLMFISQSIFAQDFDPFLNNYFSYKSYNPDKAKTYEDTEGSPYLNKEFVEGSIFINDTNYVKIPLRYNIYTDELEYRHNSVNYVLGNPAILKKAIIEQSTFVYLPHFHGGGYFEQIVQGKCQLLKKYAIKLKPQEVKPIGGIVIPPTFEKKPNMFYLALNDASSRKVTNLKSVINALADEKESIEKFIKENHIKNVKQESLIKILEYYNSQK